MPISLGTNASTVTSSFARAGFESIATINGSGVQVVEFTNIPQNYTDLLILISAATAAGNYQEGYPGIRYNSDSAANYSRLSFNFSNTINSQSGTTAQDFASAGATYAVDNPRAIPVEWYIPDYSSTDKAKASNVRIHRAVSPTGAGGIEKLIYLWNNTSAINRITITANTQNGFATYARFSLYGIGKK